MNSTERWHRWYERQKAQGLSKPKRDAAYGRAYYARRIAAGLCPKCGGKRDSSFTLCGKCRRIWKVRNATRRSEPRRPPRQESPRWSELDSRQARCRCGLLLPCNSCLASIYELASSRRAGGPVFPTGGP